MLKSNNEHVAVELYTVQTVLFVLISVLVVVLGSIILENIVKTFSDFQTYHQKSCKKLKLENLPVKR